MATRLILLPIEDLTTGESYIFRLGYYETVEDVSNDHNQYGTVGHLLAAHPTFAPEVSVFVNTVGGGKPFAENVGFTDVYGATPGNFDGNGKSIIGHSWKLKNGKVCTVVQTGSGNTVGIALQYQGTNYTLVPSTNLNVFPVTSMVYVNGTERQYMRCWAWSPSTDNYVVSFYRNSSAYVDSLPVTSTPSQSVIDFWADAYTEIPTDPYSPGGESGTGGGTGTFDGTSTPIPIPGLPSLSAVDTGFITLFNPSLTQLKNLASYMWSGTFDLNTFKKLFADPMECILGLSIVPVAVPNGGSQSVMVGNISTGVSMTLAGSQYVSLNCGTINVDEYWGSYLDYAPYSKASIYLPYCGIHPIDIDEIMDRSITVEYHVDILSGACVAFIMCADSVLYTFTGQCASSIPVSGNDFTQMINGIITASTAIGSMVATGGATAPVAVPQLVSTAVNSMKPEIEKSGSVSGTGGMLAIQTPYLILKIPRQALPKDQNTFTGYPSFITSTLGDLSGYTEVEEIHLEGIPATDGELSEILNLLKSGVIL